MLNKILNKIKIPEIPDLIINRIINKFSHQFKWPIKILNKIKIPEISDLIINRIISKFSHQFKWPIKQSLINKIGDKQTYKLLSNMNSRHNVQVSKVNLHKLKTNN